MKAIVSNAFKEAYKKLNPEQREAVDTIYGPLMVVAGPGTGKTEVLTIRIANILLKTDINPENILAITFTESGVNSMKKRLNELIGADSYDVLITTFHSFANSIIKNYPEEFDEIFGYQSIEEIKQIQIVKEIIETTKELEMIKIKGKFYEDYLMKILHYIEILKRENISPSKFEKIIQKEEKLKAQELAGKKTNFEIKKHIQKNKELAIIYKKYEDILNARGFYDYNDMILKVLNALEKNKNFLLSLQEKYQFILVDEHQDTNQAQNKILELLTSFDKNPNIFVVGDVKQAIFRFQGASLENFENFIKKYPEAKVIVLKENYRSHQLILDLSYDIFTKYSSIQIGGEKLIAQKNLKPNLIKIAGFSNKDAENYFVAKKIKEFLEQGEKLSNIAIIFRENKDAFPIAQMLGKFNIPFVIESEDNVLEDEDIQRLKIILQAVKNVGNEEFLIKAFLVNFWDIPSLDIYKIINFQKKNKKYQITDIVQSQKILKQIKVSNPLKIYEFFKKISFWQSNSSKISPLKSFEDVVRESGFLAKILTHSDGNIKLQKLHFLFDELRKNLQNNKNYSFLDFIDYLEDSEKYRIKHKMFIENEFEDRVHLLTAHRAKGLEFNVVFIVNAVDGIWGKRQKREYIQLPFSVFTKNAQESEDESDELNIFFVALTRAKNDLFITYSNFDENGNQRLATKFISELQAGLIENVNTKKYEEELSNNLKIFFNENSKTKIPTKDKEYLNKLFKEQGLSVTALNNFLECPWKYFYRNLIRIPEAPTPSLMYGNAIHSALLLFFKKINEKRKVPKVEDLIRFFEINLQSQPMSEVEISRYLKRGEKALWGYYQNYFKEWEKSKKYILEKSLEVEFEDTRLTGKLDKIELLNDNEVIIVDYKTGKPQTKNEILGLTKGSSGDYFRQLVFYKLLLSMQKKNKYIIQKEVLDFVEPTESGKYKKYEFEIQDNEVESLKEQIKKVIFEIKNLSFWNKTCGNKYCDYCNLKRLSEEKKELEKF
jgi:DNA helicase-2/ATP-dependent DNA helicase PcrA